MKKLFKIWCFTVMALLFATGCSAQKPDIAAIHIVYTTNLNGALRDCNCGGAVVGGMTRTLTLIDSLRREHPDLLLLDSGDALLSYPLPEANRTMLQLLSIAKYDALNIGDQEFVESADFIFRETAAQQLDLPHISGNLDWKSGENAQLPGIVKTDVNQLKINIYGVINPAVFGFISVPEIQVNDPAAHFADWQLDESALQILLYHGSFENAAAFVGQHPGIAAVILGHNQTQRETIEKGTIFLETGFEGEYLGHLVISRKAGEWQFNNEFIPVLADVPPHPVAHKIVDDYFRQLLK
ncbi:MAG: hypothetical protein KDE52_00555 [Calditrichaeota bacterium]|nr:hypothetical protein [Calditrichota bacterium]